MKVTVWTIPILVVGALYGGYLLRTAVTLPTTTVGAAQATGARLECIVSGVKCKGTAAFFTSLYEGVDGVLAIETYATEHKAVFTYDPAKITPGEIERVMEQEVLLNDGSRAQVFELLSQQSL
jgi:hypothetical protein